MKTASNSISAARSHGGKLTLALTAFASAAIFFPPAALAACGPDLTAQFTVQRGLMRKSIAPTQLITATNNGPAVKGPVYIEIFETPPNVWVQNYTWVSTCAPGSTFNRFYLGYLNQWDTNVTLTLTLKWADPNLVPITYNYRIVRGAQLPSPHMIPGDFDGDGKADLAVYDPPTATWKFKFSATNLVSSQVFGAPNDRFVVGDFDGDLKQDLAVFTPATATWTIHRSSDGGTPTTVFGAPNIDVPVPADYDGDGYTDLAVYRPSLQVFTVLRSTDNKIVSRQFGFPGSIPVPADYDGDGKADYAYYDSANSMFHIWKTTINQPYSFGVVGFAGLPFAMRVNSEGHASPATYNPMSGVVTVADIDHNTVYSKYIGPNGKFVACDFNGDYTDEGAIYDLASAAWAVEGQMLNPQLTPVASFTFGTPGVSIPVMAIPSSLKFPQLLPW